MSLEKAKKHLEKFGLSDRIRIAKESTATVALAAKAKMIKPEECEQIIGHAPGGVCPFGINEDVKVYLDESLKSMDSVLPACGTSDTGIELTIPELEKSSCCTGWVDITKTLD